MDQYDKGYAQGVRDAVDEALSVLENQSHGSARARIAGMAQSMRGLEEAGADG